jgi:hypothetical protein
MLFLKLTTLDIIIGIVVAICTGLIVAVVANIITGIVLG